MESAVAKPEPGVYAGATSQGFALQFSVPPAGDEVAGFASTITVYCNGSPKSRAFSPPGSAPVKGGAFRREVSPGDGATYTYQGRFTAPGKAEGALSLGSTKIVFGGVEVCVTPGTVGFEASLVGS